MDIKQLKEIKLIKTRQKRRIKELQDEIIDCQKNINFEQELNQTFGTEESGLDKLYNHDKEIIQMNTERIEQLKQEERTLKCKVLAKY
jgi:DNA-binding transcriptional regulator GbsR (MarR family)